MTQTSTKERLQKRLQRYFQVEGMNALMFFCVLIFLNIQFNSLHLIFLSYGMLMMCFILAQGTLYWWAKWSVLEDKPIFKNSLLRRFRSFKKVNIYGMILMPALLFIQWLVSGRSFVAGNFLGWAIAANGFAVLEHINYYHRQLMYDNKYDFKYLLRNKKLKDASLYKDLRENKL